MTRITTAAFDTENAKLAKAPVYFVRFFWVHPTTFAEYAFSVDFATKTVKTPTKTKRLYLNRVRGNVQTIVPEHGQSTTGQFVLEFEDVKEDGTRGEVTKYLSDPAVLLQGAITAASPANGGNLQAASSVAGYPILGTVELRDTAGKVIERIRYASLDLTNNRFVNITRGVDGTTASAHADQTKLHNGERIQPRIWAQPFLGYEDLNEADYMAIHKMEVVERRDGNPPGVMYDIEIADVQRFLEKKIFTAATPNSPITLTGNPLTLLLQVLLTTDAGGNHATYDLGSGIGASMPSFRVNVADIENVRDTKLVSPASPTFSFKITEPVRAKEWIEREILKPNNLYPFMDQNGKYTVKRYEPAPAPGSQPVLDDTIWAGANPIWEGGDRLIINEVIVLMDFDIDENPGNFNTILKFRQNESIEQFEKRAALVIESAGLKSSLNGVAIARDRALQVFKRFAFMPPVLRANLFFQKIPLEAGDITKVTDPTVINQKTGLRSLTNEIMEIVDIRPVFDPGFIEVRLLHTGAAPAVTTQAEDGAAGNLLDPTNPALKAPITDFEALTDPQSQADLAQWSVTKLVALGNGFEPGTEKKWDQAGLAWDQAGLKWDTPRETDLGTALSFVFDAGTSLVGFVKVDATLLGTSFRWDDAGLKWDQAGLKWDDISQVVLTVEAQYSKDGVTFGANAPDFNDFKFEQLKKIEGSWFGSEVGVRYFRVKFTLQALAQSVRPRVESITVRFVVRFFEDAHFGKVIASGGTTITWRFTFGDKPSVTVTPLSASHLQPRVLSADVNSALVRLLTDAGTDVGGTANVVARGPKRGN